MPGDSLHPTNSGRISPLLKDRRAINTTLEAARDFARNRRRRPGSREYEVDVESAAIFAADLTEATGAASWQSRTIVSGAWANGTPTGTNNAYPVQCGGSAFTPAATSTSIMWEEPSGSGVYAFLPIQYATASVPGFVSTASQTFAGTKTFNDGVTVHTAFISMTGHSNDTSIGFVNISGTYYFVVDNVTGGLNAPSFGIWNGSARTAGMTTTFATGDGRTATFTGGILTGLA